MGRTSPESSPAAGSRPTRLGDPVAGTEVRDERTDEPITAREKIKRISGVAPLCKIVSLKVIADETLTGDTKQKAGQGKVSWVLMAIDQIQKWNQWGKRILVHGVNMSLGTTSIRAGSPAGTARSAPRSTASSSAASASSSPPATAATRRSSRPRGRRRPTTPT